MGTGIREKKLAETQVTMLADWQEKGKVTGDLDPLYLIYGADRYDYLYLGLPPNHPLDDRQGTQRPVLPQAIRRIPQAHRRTTGALIPMLSQRGNIQGRKAPQFNFAR